MLARAYRLERSLFPALLTSRKFKNSPHFTLRIGEAVDSRPHIAVSVSKKVAKSAVVRNTVRRRVYSALRFHIKTLSPGLYLVVAKSGAQTIRGEALTREIESLLK